MASQPTPTATRDNDPSSSTLQGSLSLFPKVPSTNYGQKSQNSELKTTSVPWNPENPPKAPTLSRWLTLQRETVSPFGSIQLPSDTDSNAPLGGQLKSPLRSSDRPGSSAQDKSLSWSPQKTKKIGPRGPKPSPKVTPMKQTSPQSPDTPALMRIYRESKASVWTDDVPSPSPVTSPSKTKGPAERPASAAQRSTRNTAEMLVESLQRDSRAVSPRNSTLTRGGLFSPAPVPETARTVGYSANPGVRLVKQKSFKSQARYAEDNVEDERDSDVRAKGKGKMSMNGESESDGVRTSGVGKAL